MYLDAIRPLPLLREEEELEELDDSLTLAAPLPTLADEDDDPIDEEIRPRGGRDRFGSGNRTLLPPGAAAAVIAACSPEGRRR